MLYATAPIWGVPTARSTGVVGLQGEVELSKSATLELGYRGEFGGKVRDQAAEIKVRWAF